MRKYQKYQIFVDIGRNVRVFSPQIPHFSGFGAGSARYLNISLVLRFCDLVHVCVGVELVGNFPSVD